MTAPDPAGATTPTGAERKLSVAGVTARLIGNDRRAYAAALSLWIAFHSFPLVMGGLVKLILDHLTKGSGGTPWMLLAALLGAEVTRWSLLVLAAWQFSGAWTGFLTVPRVNALTHLATAPGATAGRLPGSSGEAVSRFRDDTHDLAMVADSWLDLAGVGITAVVAVSVMFAVDARVGVVVLVPLALALGLSLYLGPRLRAWRRAARQATSGVTSFIGDTFAGILAVKTAGAEAAVSRHFESLNHARAAVSRRDQMGRQVLNSIGAGTGEITIGIVLVVIAQTFRSGELSVGDVALFASYVTLAARLPRWIGRAAAWYQQAEVSVDRLAELSGGDRQAPVARVATHLRHGPPVMPAPPAEADPLVELRVEGLTAVHPSSGRGIRHADLVVAGGQVVAITGEVGAGKTTLLRALLGVVPAQEGRISWNGVEVGDPATELIPPLVAYLPQVPRLFSEPLAETVLLGRSDADLDRAIWMACLDEDVAEMPDGVHTLIGPRGLRLSGGQIQRAAAARAFVRTPELLVVDDLSSALDVETEQRLWQRLASDRRRTVLMVSHRDHVLGAADQVLVVEDGRIRPG